MCSRNLGTTFSLSQSIFLGCMSCCKQVIPDMVEKGSGNIIILGATGSLRGGANFSAFASAKNGQRALAESMARHLGPKGTGSIS